MERLDKFLVGCAVGSRSQVKDILKAGRITVDGAVIRDAAQKIDPNSQTVCLDGAALSGKRRVVVMLNKPAGYVTATEDRDPTVMELLPREFLVQDVKPVGRLDKATEGLLLFTNDGDFSNAVMHPSTHIPKLYRVTLRQPMSEEQRLQFEEGIVLDGRRTAPAEVRVVSSAPDRCVTEITLYEGRNRQIRRMCESLGLEVIRLRRSAIGKVKLGMLPVGNWRYLSPEEVRDLVMATGSTKKIAAGYIKYGKEPDRDYHTARR